MTRRKAALLAAGQRALTTIPVDVHSRAAVLVNERKRTVLQLASRVALRVNVGDLLKLERPLQGNREVDASPQEDHVLGALKAVGQGGTALVVVGHQGFELLGQLAQLGHQGLELLPAPARAAASLALAHPPLGKGQGQGVCSKKNAK